MFFSVKILATSLILFLRLTVIGLGVIIFDICSLFFILIVFII